MCSFVTKQAELKVGRGQIGLAWSGQAGFAFKDNEGLVYYIDPYLSNACSKSIGYHRIIPTPVKAQDVIADYILFTHHHKDHLDPDSIPIISQSNPSIKFVGPASCAKILLEMGISEDRIIIINREETISIGNVRVKAVLAVHTDDSVGYMIESEDIKMYITGDTIYSEELIPATDDHLDIMMTCINGRLGCMNIPDAARLCAHIQPKYVVPMHYGMFKENTANPNEFIRQIENYSGITQGQLLEHGGWYLYDKSKQEFQFHW